jgi:hypothetical protein
MCSESVSDSVKGATNIADITLRLDDFVDTASSNRHIVDILIDTDNIEAIHI